jgi:hypothetical protein
MVIGVGGMKGDVACKLVTWQVSPDGCCMSRGSTASQWIGGGQEGVFVYDM